MFADYGIQIKFHYVLCLFWVRIVTGFPNLETVYNFTLCKALVEFEKKRKRVKTILE